MNKSLILSIISSVSTLISLLFMINIKDGNKEKNIITISLSITFIYMILVSLLDLLPESLKILKNKAFLGIFIYIMINYTIIYILIKLGLKNKKFKVGEGSLYFLGVINAITLLIHNIPEGIITYITSKYNFKLGLKVAISIIMHNIPEGISICIPIFYSTKSKKRGSIFVLIAALGELIGTLFALFFLNNGINQKIIAYMMISISSLMIYISLEEIFPKIYLKNKKSVLIGILIGLIIFIINKILL